MQTKGSTQWYKLIAELIAHVTEEIVTLYVQLVQTAKENMVIHVVFPIYCDNLQ